MAKQSKSVSFKNATINFDEMTILECTKDDEKIFSLEKVLKDWEGIDGISLTIKYDDEIDEILAD